MASSPPASPPAPCGPPSSRFVTTSSTTCTSTSTSSSPARPARSGGWPGGWWGQRPRRWCSGITGARSPHSDDRALRDAGGGVVRPSEREEREVGVGGAVLGVDRLPQLVPVAPGAREQEVEALPAAVEQDEPRFAADVHRAARRLAMQELARE